MPKRRLSLKKNSGVPPPPNDKPCEQSSKGRNLISNIVLICVKQGPVLEIIKGCLINISEISKFIK